MNNYDLLTSVVNSCISEDMSNKDKCVVIDELISVLKEIKSSYSADSFESRQIVLKGEVSEFLKAIKSMSVASKSRVKRGLGVNFNFEDMSYIPLKSEKYHIKSYNRNLWDLCARIYCLYSCDMKLTEKTESFATQLGKVINSSSGVAKFETLLASSTDKFEYFSRDLIRFVRQLHSANKSFDIIGLLVDLLNWNLNSKSVQLKWADDFYSSQGIKNN